VSVRALAIVLITLLLPLGLNAPSVKACSTKVCCGPNCSSAAPVNQLGCCKAPAAPDRAISQAQNSLDIDSIGSMPAAAPAITIQRLQNMVITREYSPPGGLRSLALLCSRQI